jgi:hypothetical protein
MVDADFGDHERRMGRADPAAGNHDLRLQH